MRTLLSIAGVVLLTLVVLIAVGWLALRRGDIAYDELDARYANADSRFVELPGGVRMHYRDQGLRDGPVLVLVHGFGASLHTWEPWARELGRDHRVISLDLPGYGLTRTPEAWRGGPTTFVDAIEAFAAAQGLARFSLAGNSMGGAAAWNYALAHPGRLEGLILVDTAGWPEAESAGGETPLIFRALGHPVGRALLRDLDATSLTRDGLRSAFVDDAFVTPAMVRLYTDLSRAPGRRAQILDATPGRRSPDATPERLAAIMTPTLVMTGEADAIIPAVNSRRFAEAIPGATLVTYPNVGHVPQEEVAERSAADVRAFLEGAVAR